MNPQQATWSHVTLNTIYYCQYLITPKKQHNITHSHNLFNNSRTILCSNQNHNDKNLIFFSLLHLISLLAISREIWSISALSSVYFQSTAHCHRHDDADHSSHHHQLCSSVVVNNSCPNHKRIFIYSFNYPLTLSIEKCNSSIIIISITTQSTRVCWQPRHITPNYNWISKAYKNSLRASSKAFFYSSSRRERKMEWYCCVIIIGKWNRFKQLPTSHPIIHLTAISIQRHDHDHHHPHTTSPWLQSFFWSCCVQRWPKGY